MLPQTRIAIYRYKKLAFFIKVVTESITDGGKTCQYTRKEGTINARIAGPPIFRRIGNFIPNSLKTTPITIITAKPPIISLGRLPVLAANITINDFKKMGDA